ncbi:Uncharacterized conserved protein YloU, alkaline shock protein (Asp23) family [Klenkia soli]|uniref:Uncharacterized conserved protein YloU, alkaline shock protein (Asp23) family n=1 Tax=Klenkia soli TaxID=1052260 RepID=A0A1H0EAW9_9ACTN|nr:Asp23/Gls24 family envelope stress response protein [Klenkia soli]SDN79542.1 Uncharacterized conserved protein YloU, alkaline shock protein (Asp23) family [Klenkia soli]
MTTPTAAVPAPAADPLPEPEHRGRTTIADRVVERIAAAAAAEVDAATGTARRVLGVAVSSADRPRVSARVHGEEATVEIDMSVSWPAPVRQVTRRVREHVGERLVTLVGLRSARIDVHVAALVVERAPEQKRVV